MGIRGPVFEYVNRAYGLNVKRGDRCAYDGNPGRVTSSRDARLLIALDERPMPRLRVHPKDENLRWLP